jgi:hypothetical protein
LKHFGFQSRNAQPLRGEYICNALQERVNFYYLQNSLSN